MWTVKFLFKPAIAQEFTSLEDAAAFLRKEVMSRQQKGLTVMELEQGIFLQGSGSLMPFPTARDYLIDTGIWPDGSG